MNYRLLATVRKPYGSVALYVEERLSLRRKRRRKRSQMRQPLPEAVAANQVWSVDFMTDALSSERRFRILNVVDDYTRECLATQLGTQRLILTRQFLALL